MTSEFNLSEKIGLAGEMYTMFTDTDVIKTGDVKEFIRRLKEFVKMTNSSVKAEQIYEGIDALAGERLI